MFIAATFSSSAKLRRSGMFRERTERQAKLHAASSRFNFPL